VAFKPIGIVGQHIPSHSDPLCQFLNEEDVSLLPESQRFGFRIRNP